jgi:hypothetical protein
MVGFWDWLFGLWSATMPAPVGYLEAAPSPNGNTLDPNGGSTPPASVATCDNGNTLDPNGICRPPGS